MPCFFIFLRHYQSIEESTDIARYLLYKHDQCLGMVNVVLRPIAAYLKFQQIFLDGY
ncbi:hypothetical protein D3C72_1955980 [compost metagenome]